ncbi:MAG: AAA-like domain-containing protein [Candidatus Hodarchaeota archaeon]
MLENPYKFIGPLFPEEDKLVCIPRKKELDGVISGIMRGDYWTILGPRQIGKTTFLNQLIHELSAFTCIYFDMESCPSTDELFFKLLMDTIADQVLKDKFKIQIDDEKDFGPEINFYNFLKSIDSKGNKKIVFFFDEIERATVVKDFLKLWRKIFNERNYHPELKKYAVVIAGSVDLIDLTIGKTSPFNISKKLYLGELPKSDAEILIDHPTRELGIHLDPEAKNQIVLQTACHPQLIQQLCYLVVEQKLKKDKWITKLDVENAIEVLFVESDNLSTLANEIKSDNMLMELIVKILNGEEVHYLPFQKYSIAGTGPIIQRNKLCSIRNKIYEDFIKDIIDPTIGYKGGEDEPTYLTTIYLKELSKNSLLSEPHKKLLKYLFSSDAIKIEITRNSLKLPNLELDFKERMIFCYLAYKKYNAAKKGFSDWKKIPLSCEYRLSSNVENNKGQLEWEILEDRFTCRRITIYNEIIRTWILSIRRKLKLIDAHDLIPIESGRGRGYVIKGKVDFVFK